MWIRRRHQWGCRGISSLEFVMVLPMLFLILLTGVEFSRAWMVMNVVTQAAREGARVGTVTNPTEALNRINAVLAAANLVSAFASVTCLPDPCAPDSQVTAIVTVNFQTLFPAMLPMLSGPMPLTTTTIMRFE